MSDSMSIHREEDPGFWAPGTITLEQGEFFETDIVVMVC